MGPDSRGHLTPDPRSRPNFTFQHLSAQAGPAEAFLTAGHDIRERLACAGDCLTPDLCAAVAMKLTQRSQDGLVPEQDIQTLRIHGIAVDAYGDEICPGRLVRRAVSSEFGGEFTVATDDPLNRAELYTRVAECLRAAVGSVLTQLDKGLRQ